VNASTPSHDHVIRYCAPELLDAGDVTRAEKRKPTTMSDVYSLSLVIVEVYQLDESMMHPRSDCFHNQLVTGEIPFADYPDPKVIILVLKGKRPSKPAHFNAPGMTPAVWKIAKKCWHEEARERPEANVVLKNLENLAESGVYTHCMFLSGMGDN